MQMPVTSLGFCLEQRPSHGLSPKGPGEETDWTLEHRKTQGEAGGNDELKLAQLHNSTRRIEIGGETEDEDV